MKKVIALLLAAAMVFSLAACGAVTMVTELLSVSVKGNGKKELTITCTDKFTDVYMIEYEVDESEEPVYVPALAKEAANKHVYKISGAKPGTAAFALTFRSGNEFLAKVTMTIDVNDALHVFYSDLQIVDRPSFTTDSFVDGDGNPAGEFSISDEESGIKIIQLENGGGWWEIGRYDDAIIDVKQSEIEDDDTMSVFYVIAKAAGSTQLYLINPDTESQVMLNFTVKMNDVGDLWLILDNYLAGPWEKVTEDENLKLLQEVEEEFGKTIIPNDSYISGIGMEKGANGYADIVFEYDRMEVDYQIIRGLMADEYYSYVADEFEIVSDETITVGDSSVRLFFTDKGLGTAIWPQDDVAVRMTFLSEKADAEDIKEFITELLTLTQEGETVQN